MAKGVTKPEVVHVSSSDSLHAFNGLNYANADRFVWSHGRDVSGRSSGNGPVRTLTGYTKEHLDS